jgi:hypothetical protein
LRFWYIASGGHYQLDDNFEAFLNSLRVFLFFLHALHAPASSPFTITPIHPVIFISTTSNGSFGARYWQSDMQS